MTTVKLNEGYGLDVKITDVLKRVCGEGAIALHEPKFTGNEWLYVKDCIDSTFVSSVGAYVDRFEQELADFIGVNHAVAVSNGTSALHVALLLAGVLPGDEVLVPALSFVATANAVHYSGAIPHFVDSNFDTLGIDPEALDKWLSYSTAQQGGFCVNKHTGRIIRAIVPMHVFGHPCDLDDLLLVCQKYGLVMVEDAAESLGSFYQGRHTGTFGLLGVLSFNGNKTITTGGGGAIITNDLLLAKRAKHLTTTAKLPHKWEFVHDEVGFNYRMPNLNAALGCAQLEQLPKFIESKRRLYERYKKEFSGLIGASLITEPSGSQSNYWLQGILLDELFSSQRDAILSTTNEHGMMTRPVWKLMPALKPYASNPSAPLPVAESLERRVINIPSSAGLA